MADNRHIRTMTPEDEAAAAALAPFFAAARATTPDPPVSLLSAILADAAEATAPQPAPAATSAPARARWRAALAPALGGWRAATALAACALLGFWLGLAGGVTIEGTTLQAGAAAAEADDPVEAFFDLAAVE
jgi:hypothetical protein